MKMSVRKQRLTAVAVLCALFASLMLGSAAGLAVTEQEVLFNGSFERGFSQIPGCGAVGKGWGCFTNGGSVAYGFYDDQWEAVRADGLHSQLIEMNTMQPAASEPDRFAGIYQTVNVVKGAIYQFKASGLVREALKDGNKPDPNDDPYRYRVQWGYTAQSSSDWTEVTNWIEIPWDQIDPRTEPSGMQEYLTSFDAPSDRFTIFIRLWKKWGTVYREVDFNVDGLSLWGPGVVDRPKQDGVIVIPTPGGKPPIATRPERERPVEPVEKSAYDCYGPSQVMNGNFESGFVKGVGNYWKSFNNGGKAGYGFYDETWSPVIQDGKHGQLIEINTKGMLVGDADRVAGIYQVVKGLVPGQTYMFSVWGQMREEDANPYEDEYRYRVQWGFASAGGSNTPSRIVNWTELPWDNIYLRTAPGAMAYFSEEFVAPSNSIVLAVRGLKKWGTPYRELDVDLDLIQVQGCTLHKEPRRWSG